MRKTTPLIPSRFMCALSVVAFLSVPFSAIGQQVSYSADPAKTVPEGEPIPIPIPPGSVCYEFETISAGQLSGFGGYCGAPIPPAPKDGDSSASDRATGQLSTGVAINRMQSAAVDLARSSDVTETNRVDWQPVTVSDPEIAEQDVVYADDEPYDANDEAMDNTTDEAASSDRLDCRARVARPALAAVVRDLCTWQDLWSQHTSFILPPPPAPQVDFDKYVVVAVISGPRPNGCYGMGIDRITGESGMRTVHIVEHVPCPDGNVACTQVITNSHHFIKVCKQFLPPEIPVCFDGRFSRNDCAILGFCPHLLDEP